MFWHFAICVEITLNVSAFPPDGRGGFLLVCCGDFFVGWSFGCLCGWVVCVDFGFGGLVVVWVVVDVFFVGLIVSVMVWVCFFFALLDGFDHTFLKC